MDENVLKDIINYREAYYVNLKDSVIPFWLKYSPDRHNGGTYSCLDEDGTIYDTKKYLWLVGRSAWMFSRLYNTFEKNPEFLNIARLNIEFLDKYAEDEKGRYYFSLTEEGNPWFFQRKPYSAVFSMMAFLEYYLATGELHYKEKAIALFWRIKEWIEKPELLDRPVMTGVPGMSNLANVMVLAGMALELNAVEAGEEYIAVMKSALENSKKHISDEFGIFMENVPFKSIENFEQWPEARIFNPGHSIEVVWFILHLLEILPDTEMQEKALEVLENSLNFGWDDEYKGIYYFMDVRNKPTLQLESGMKLWWPHTEAIYAIICAYSLTKDKKWLSWLEKVHNYTFDHFVDKKYGGWFGYCNRYGNLTHRLKGGNYKGFFHVPRALLFSIQKLDHILQAETK